MRPEVPTRRRRVSREASITLQVALGVWAVFGLVCAASMFWSMRTHGHSPVRMVVYCLVVWCAWAFATPVIAWLGQRVPLIPFSWRAAALHVGAALVFGVLHHVWWTLMLVVMQPFDAMGPQSLADALTGEALDNLFLEATAYFAVLGVTYAVDSQRRLRERELRAVQLETSLTQAKLTALELQLQPHFLFNTLHAIGGLVRQSRGPEAIEMIAGLSDLLRYSLEHAGKHLVPLEQELAIVGRYLEIQRLRFSDRLVVVIDAPVETLGLQLPALLLQPLVENAIRHGIEQASEPGTIHVRARLEAGQLQIRVSNTGPAIEQVAEGVGIANTRARLDQLFAGQHTFTLGSEGGTTTATVTMPTVHA